MCLSLIHFFINNRKLQSRLISQISAFWWTRRETVGLQHFVKSEKSPELSPMFHRFAAVTYSTNRAQRCLISVIGRGAIVAIYTKISDLIM